MQTEVLRKAAQETRFRPAASAWRKLTPDYIEVLPDDPTDQLSRVVNRITNQRMDERLKQSKDLGETMVIAHAVVAAESGADVIVLIDDGSGAETATRELHRLRRLHTNSAVVGSITLVSTVTVLAKAAGTEHIQDRAEMRELYRRLRGLDDGLPPIEKTYLLSTAQWKTCV